MAPDHYCYVDRELPDFSVQSNPGVMEEVEVKVEGTVQMPCYMCGIVYVCLVCVCGSRTEHIQICQFFGGFFFAHSLLLPRGGIWKTKLIFLKLLFEQFSSSSFYLQKAFNVPYFEEKKCIRHVFTLSVYLQHKYPSVICVLINTCTVYRHKLAENMDKLLFHVLVNAQAMRCMVFSCASLFPSNAFLSLVKLMARICRG